MIEKKKQKTIALFPNIKKRQSINIAKGIREFLSHRNTRCVADDAVAKKIGAYPLTKVNLEKIDMSISLGGDGTILGLVQNHPEIIAPIVGVNMGSLGFMADIPLTEIYPTLEVLLKDDYKIENRLMINGKSSNGHHGIALNEVVVHRAKNPCLIELALHVDGNYLNTFAADGIIIATPSGSTAYSLAAGGPILAPDLNAFVITPICPHTISNRPIVLMPKKNIQIQYISDYEPIEVTFDGCIHFEMNTGDVFHVSALERPCKLIKLPGHDYFSTLRKKLGWSGKLKT